MPHTIWLRQTHARRPIHVAVRCCVGIGTHVLAHRRQHQHARSRTRPRGSHSRLVHRPSREHGVVAHTTPPTPTQLLAHAPTAVWYAGSSRKNDVVAHTKTVLSAPQHAHGAFSPTHYLTHRSYHPWWPRSTRTAPFSSSGFPPSSRPTVSPSCLQRHALRPHTSTHAPAAHSATLARTHARKHARGRPTVNDATCSPPAWLTGKLHDGEYGAYAHRLGGPLSSRPLSPRPCKAAAPKGPAFCFLNNYKARAGAARWGAKAWGMAGGLLGGAGPRCLGWEARELSSRHPCARKVRRLRRRTSRKGRTQRRGTHAARG